MSKILRQAQTVFGGLGATGNFGKFGSRAAGTPINTKDIETIQELAAWTSGWQEAVLASNAAPFLEDMNSVCYVLAYQASYLLQEGIAEYNVDTTYFIGSIVKKTGTGELYRSKIDDNLGNALPSMADNTEWAWQNPSGPGSGLDADTVDGIEAATTPEDNKLLALDSNSQFPASVIAGFGNAIKSDLVVESNVASPLIQVDIDAVLLSVQGVILSAVNLTVDIAASGANGLDTGAEAASTWYAVHVITNDDGTLVASLLSLSATSPTLPGTFTRFRRVGWVRNTSASDFRTFTKIVDQVLFNDPATTEEIDPNGIVSLAEYVPPTSTFADIHVWTHGTRGAAPGSGTAVNVQFRTDSGSSYVTMVFCQIIGTSNGAHVGGSNKFRIRTTNTQTVDINDVSTAPKITHMFIMGYVDSSGA